jgi:D-alanyl-D-alanine carboxypeptidase
MSELRKHLDCLLRRRNSALKSPELYTVGAFELIRASAMGARTLHAARELSHSTWLLRRKQDGRYIAVLCAKGRASPLGRLNSGPNLNSRVGGRSLPQVLRTLGMGWAEANALGLPEHSEPARLVLAGQDRYRRPLWLLEPAARAWRTLRSAAALDGVQIDAISGFRSIEYQAGIFRRKLNRGLSLEQILRVNAAPGFSEHHSGRAIDIGTRGEPPAEVSFESTTAFAWLQTNAHRFGFRLSYPRDNPSGIQYEPWHWCWHPPGHGQHVDG